MAKINWSALTLNERVKKSEVDNGARARIPTEVAEKIKIRRILEENFRVYGARKV